MVLESINKNLLLVLKVLGKRSPQISELSFLIPLFVISLIQPPNKQTFQTHICI